MATFIAGRIIAARAISLEAGQAKYRAYFVTKPAATLYVAYKGDVDTILNTDGYGDCIVTV